MKNKKYFLIILIGVLMFGGIIVYLIEKPSAPEYVPGEVIVKFRDEVSREEAREDWFNRRGQLAEEIEKEDIVKWAQVNHVARLDSIPGLDF